MTEKRVKYSADDTGGLAKEDVALDRDKTEQNP